MTTRSWVARHPFGAYGVRCDLCASGWYSTTDLWPVLAPTPEEAEQVRERHDRHEHQLSTPHAQTLLGGG